MVFFSFGAITSFRICNIHSTFPLGIGPPNNILVKKTQVTFLSFFAECLVGEGGGEEMIFWFLKVFVFFTRPGAKMLQAKSKNRKGRAPLRTPTLGLQERCSHTPGCSLVSSDFSRWRVRGCWGGYDDQHHLASTHC